MTNFFVVITVILQSYFMILEIFLWDKPRTYKTFGLSEDFAIQSKTMALNQGLYNGFLAAGLVWSLLSSDIEFSFQLKFFFLSCMFIAGVVGGITVTKKIILVQALPALIPLILLLIHRIGVL